MVMAHALKSDELQTFRESLLNLRARLEGDVSQLTEEALGSEKTENSGSLSKVPIHPADAAADSFDQEIDLSMIENEQETLAQISEALGRIEAKTYGLCGECGNNISKPRLQALPYTNACIDCARALESQG